MKKLLTLLLLGLFLAIPMTVGARKTIWNSGHQGRKGCINKNRHQLNLEGQI